MSYYVVSSDYLANYDFPTYEGKFRGHRFIVSNTLTSGYFFARDVTQDDLGIRCPSEGTPPVMLWEDLNAKYISNS